jgi:hypothetical protein
VVPLAHAELAGEVRLDLTEMETPVVPRRVQTLGRPVVPVMLVLGAREGLAPPSMALPELNIKYPPHTAAAAVEPETLLEPLAAVAETMVEPVVVEPGQVVLLKPAVRARKG